MEFAASAGRSVARYDRELDLRKRGDSAVRCVELVGHGKRVLEFGCGSGFVSRRLLERGNVVVGIERDPEAAALASRFCERVVVGDLERLDLARELAGERFDVILLGDVLEHLRDPLTLLAAVRPMLVPPGCLVITIPNTAHWSVRMDLLLGRFEYTPTGILDETHLRFFTRDSFSRLLTEAGYFVASVQALEQGLPRGLDARLRDAFPRRGTRRDILRHLRSPDARAFQYAFVATLDGHVPEEAARLERELREVEAAARRGLAARLGERAAGFLRR